MQSVTTNALRAIGGQENARAVKDAVAAPRRALVDTSNRRNATVAGEKRTAEILSARNTTEHAIPRPTTRPRRAQVAKTDKIQVSVASQLFNRSHAVATSGARPVIHFDEEPMQSIDEDVEMAQEAEKEQTESYSERRMRMGVEDIDAADASDPQAVTEYVVEIMEYMRSIEPDHMPSQTFINKHSDLSWNSRSLLNNWLVEVHWRYKFYPETLYLAVNFLDRYLSEVPTPVTRKNLQLVGTACLVVAAKFEEIVVPCMGDFAHITGNNFTENEIIDMERQVLLVLKFNLNFPSPMTFLRRISKAEDYDIPTRTVAKYLMEVTVLHQNFLPYTPSLIAAASTCLARRILKKDGWTNVMEFYSGYSETELKPCISHMIQFVQESNEDFRAVYKKYSSSKFLRASLFVEQEVRKHNFDTSA